MPINGQSYDWEDIVIYFNGGQMVSVQEISYSDSKERKFVYGKGSKPLTVGSGNYEASGKLVLLRPEYDIIANIAKVAGLTVYDLKPQQIIVTYAAKKEEGDFITHGAPTVDVLRDISFEKRDFSAKQNDQGLTVSLDFKAMELIV